MVKLPSFSCQLDLHALHTSMCTISINNKPLNSPEGTYAVITKHGEFLEIKKEGGIYMCMPYVSLKWEILYRPKFNTWWPSNTSSLTWKLSLAPLSTTSSSRLMSLQSSNARKTTLQLKSLSTTLASTSLISRLRRPSLNVSEFLVLFPIYL